MGASIPSTFELLENRQTGGNFFVLERFPRLIAEVVFRRVLSAKTTGE
jgi:hypothetical protein